MADFKIPHLKKNSNKFLFKKKLPNRRKSKGKLLKDSFVMFSLSVFLIFLNYSIPNKLSIFKNFFNNIIQLKSLLFKSLSNLYEIFIVLFILVSLAFVAILILGVMSRVIKIVKYKSRKS